MKYKIWRYHQYRQKYAPDKSVGACRDPLRQMTLFANNNCSQWCSWLKRYNCHQKSPRFNFRNCLVVLFKKHANNDVKNKMAYVYLCGRVAIAKPLVILDITTHITRAIKINGWTYMWGFVYLPNDFLQIVTVICYW